MDREAKVLAVWVWLVLSIGGGFLRADDLERTLDAIAQAESAGDPNAVGDGGRAIGLYQIHRAYWQDGTRFLKVRWPYSDARDPVKARQVARAYLRGYQRAKGYPATAETWARIHNGGPNGPKRRATLPYWRRVQTFFAPGP